MKSLPVSYEDMDAKCKNKDGLECVVLCKGGSVAEWSACWTHAQKGLGSNRSRDAVG